MNSTPMSAGLDGVTHVLSGTPSDTWGIRAGAHFLQVGATGAVDSRTGFFRAGGDRPRPALLGSEMLHCFHRSGATRGYCRHRQPVIIAQAVKALITESTTIEMRHPRPRTPRWSIDGLPAAIANSAATTAMKSATGCADSAATVHVIVSHAPVTVLSVPSHVGRSQREWEAIWNATRARRGGAL
jgi:hypothetical protein